MDPDAWIGRVLHDRYRILRRLGGGGMGAVFVAEQLTLHKEVAVKVVRPELANSGEIAARFAREAMAMAQFEHPHVASAIDYGVLDDGSAYFVMQLVRGDSLRSLLRAGGALPWRKACAIAAQVADALSAARASGVVHRDLKPDNILIESREDGSELVKILDFGIAQVDEAAASTAAVEGAKPGQTITQVGTVMGTPGYMAPEQAVGGKVDHRADLYSLGVVLWECVAGRELWVGSDAIDVLTRQLKEDAPPIRSVAQEAALPLDLELIIQQLLSRRPDDRPDQAGDVRDALRALSLMAAGGWEATRGGPSLAKPPEQNQAVYARATRAFLGQRAETRWMQVAALGVVVGSVVLIITAQPSMPSKPPTHSVILDDQAHADVARAAQRQHPPAAPAAASEHADRPSSPRSPRSPR
ncbi:MAG: serine/threonine-protein kinase, partial [Myxococcales bacterium]|nr:serine/threonine-protein kinase [Myxococcales bacterium]